MEQHQIKALLEPILSKAVNAAIAARAPDLIEHLVKSLSSGAQTEVRGDSRATAWLLVNTPNPTWANRNGTLFVGDFTDQQGLSAHMQLVHSSGVDPALIRGCGDVMNGKFACSSMYNVSKCCKVMSGTLSCEPH